MSDQAFIVIGTIVGWLGFSVFSLLTLTFITGWVQQRSRKRRRCPRCWYDMQGTPGMRCSECGYEAKRERKLYKTRKHPWWTIASLVVLIGGYALYTTPRVKQRGWIGAVPTTALVAAMPWMEWPQPWRYSSPWGPTGPTPLGEILFEELQTRLFMQNDCWNWQERLVAERCIMGDSDRLPMSDDWLGTYGELLRMLDSTNCASKPQWIDRAFELIEVRFDMRSEWSINQPVYASVGIHTWTAGLYEITVVATPVSNSAVAFTMNSSDRNGRLASHSLVWNDGQTLLGEIDDVGDTLEWDIEIRGIEVPAPMSSSRNTLFHAYRAQLPTRFVDSPTTLTPVHSDRASAVLRNSFAPTLRWYPGGPNVEPYITLQMWSMLYLPPPEDEALLGMTFPLSLELMCDGNRVKQLGMWFEVHVPPTRNSLPLGDSGEWTLHPAGDIFSFRFDHPEFVDIENGTWTLNVKSDPTLALRNAARDRYWDGEFTLTVQVATPNR